MRSPLLRWYRRHRRHLPWRRTTDPYAIWVAETMLQQTRSETVLAYYRRFLRRFPTLAALARAPESAVLARWSGLGYYARARNLRRAARCVLALHGGRLPTAPAELVELPGIGRYTAGAVASIAFGVRAPVLDGNVARVLSRHFEIPGALRSSAVERKLWTVAEELMPRGSPGDWNQALMELGATLCRAKAPACSCCPLRKTCAANLSGRVDRFPEPSRRRVMRRVRRACVVLERGDRALLVRRDEGRLLRGLWEFPSREASDGRPPRAVAREVASTIGAAHAPLRLEGKIEHTIMNSRIETQVFVAQLAGRTPPRPAGARWFRWSDLAALPLSAAGLRIARLRDDLGRPTTGSSAPVRRVK
jgi:A/G-specific adenine glycosylase